jgi:hypothetical protein
MRISKILYFSYTKKFLHWALKNQLSEQKSYKILIRQFTTNDTKERQSQRHFWDALATKKKKSHSIFATFLSFLIEEKLASRSLNSFKKIYFQVLFVNAPVTYSNGVNICLQCIIWLNDGLNSIISCLWLRFMNKCSLTVWQGPCIASSW